MYQGQICNLVSACNRGRFATWFLHATQLDQDLSRSQGGLWFWQQRLCCQAWSECYCFGLVLGTVGGPGWPWQIEINSSLNSKVADFDTEQRQTVNEV